MAKSTASRILLPLLGLFFLAGIFVWRLSLDPLFISQFMSLRKTSVADTSTLLIHGTKITAVIADTEALRMAGLSGRASLPDGEGLLMKFSADTLPGIWMKDMNFPIDVVWIDSNWTITQVTPLLRPESYPKVFYPDAPVRFVLEIPASFSDIHNIKAGDTIER